MKKPRRVLLIAVDGGYYDLLEKYDLPNISELIEEGVSFRNAIAGHAFTATASGIATISTGADISVHGIISTHEWYDSRLERAVYSVNEHGEAVNLKAQTFGDVFKAARPGAKVASICTKDRTAILLAGHKPDLILYSYRERTGATEDIRFTGAGVNKDRYRFSERLNHKTPDFIDDLSLPRYVDWVGDGFKLVKYETAMAPCIDDFITDAALRVMKHQKPNVLCIGLVSPNIVAHYHPLDSSQMRDSARTIDANIGRLVEGLKETGLEEETLVIITADHGMTKVEGRIDITYELRSKGCDDVEKNITYILGGGTGGLYLKSTSNDSVDKAIEALGSIEHVRGVWQKYDTEAPWFVKCIACNHAPDLILLPEYKYTFEGAEKKEYLPNSHGGPYISDANIMMVWKGPGVNSRGSVGERLNITSVEPIKEDLVDRLPRQRDIAPTIERLLDLSTPETVCGRVLPIIDRVM